MAKFGHFLSLKILWFGQNQHFFCDKFSPLNHTKKMGLKLLQRIFLYHKIGGEKKKKEPLRGMRAWFFQKNLCLDF
jgi:hemolysin-activating ACP:hemolysin acyltransferase